MDRVEADNAYIARKRQHMLRNGIAIDEDAPGARPLWRKAEAQALVERERRRVLKKLAEGYAK
jgi:hypothetical protein